jgi:1-acyl-sn-glycerol-3-phosphate acyltransferase
MFTIAFLIFSATFAVDRRLVILHQFSSFWASMYLWAMPAWSVTVEGRNAIRKGTTYVVVSNHQSQLDILVAFRLFFPFKWVSKAEVFRLPFIGWNMNLNRYVKLFRGDGDSVRQMMADCEAHIKNGSSVYFFPEGTRSETGVMRPFKPGAFILAHKMKVPILPIAINGTKNALPKNSVDFHGRHHLRIRVLDEIPYERFKNLSVEETAAMVREYIGRYIDEHGDGGRYAENN